MNRDIFAVADTKVTTLLQMLENAKKYFPTIRVPKTLLEKGFTIYKGIIVPLDSVSHRYLFDFYDSNFWNAYTLLCRTVYEEREAKLSEFTFRALIEMGIDECFILFHQVIDSIEKRKYILLKTLVDYSSIETGQQDMFNKWFTDLMREEKDFIDQHFTDKQKLVLKSLGENLNKSPEEGYTRALISTRKLCMQIKEEIITKHKKVGDSKFSNAYQRMKSGEAHTMHGNIFLLPHRLKEQSKETHLFRVYTYLFYSGIEALTGVISFLKNDEFTRETTKVLNDLNNFKVIFSQAWATYQQDPR